MGNIEKDIIIKMIKKRLNDWAFGDIKKASNGGAKMGSFILASCLIDYLTCFYFGTESSGVKYKQFCEKYLKAYNPKDLYKSLRCKLVHNYAEGGRYIFTDANKHFHLKKMKDKTIINLEDFLADINKAMKNYFQDVEMDEKLTENLCRRHKEIGILGLTKIDIEISNATYSEGASACVFNDDNNLAFLLRKSGKKDNDS